MKPKFSRIVAIIAATFFLGAAVLVTSIGFDPRLWPAALGWTPFEPFRVRTGLPLTKQKLEAGSPIVVGFIGGSITQNAEPDGFVAALRKHWTEKYPAASVRTINAGLAGTDSAWGAKRIDRDLLEAKPDVVFVEFAVNDGERDSSPDMERIVRKIHHANENAEIVFIYTTSDTAFRKLSKKKLPDAIREHEEVAEYYDVPSIVFGSDLYANIRSGKFSWEHFFQDACHPKTAGYLSYNKDFIAATDQLLRSNQPSRRDIPSPLVGNFELYPTKRLSLGGMNNADRDATKQKQAISPERMPALGSQWIDQPVFKGDNGSEWKLEYAALPSLPGESDPAALEVEWLPARWFEEAGGFTGQRSRLIAENAGTGGSSLKIVPLLTGGSVEVPQVVWKPAKTGEYLIEVTAAKIQGHVNGQPAFGGFELFTRDSGQALVHRAAVSAHDGEPLQLRQSLSMKDGQELVIRPFARGYESLEFEGFQIAVHSPNSIAVSGVGVGLLR